MGGGSWITFEGQNRGLDGYLVLPEGGGSGLPAVIVIQEIWGLEDHIKDVARRFADEGYVALAPDLYTGEWSDRLTPERIAAAMRFIRGASQEVQRDPSKLEGAISGRPQEEQDAIRILRRLLTPEQRQAFARDLLGAVRYLQGRPEVDGERIGSIGFCMGGGISAELATLCPDLRAAVVFYGQNPPPERVGDIRAPVLGIYGGKDRNITGAVPELEEEMKRAGKDFRYHVYPEAPHAFFNDTRPNYRKDAAQDAWKRTLEFFGETLKR
jgi:carboxymethylenebutenolidase